MQLEPTGERLIEEFYKNSHQNYLIYLFHMATYNYVRDYVAGKQVLDYGCGSGYGTHHISSLCAKVTGVDIADNAIDYALQHYQAPNLTFHRVEPADQAPLPYPDSSFDTVISFQVIEHISDPDTYLSEIRRVLKPGGVFICATPDRATRLLPGQKPWNMWHVYEYNSASLLRTLSRYFQSIDLLSMGGRREVLEIELRRTRRLSWLTLPVTLPFVPEAIRIAALKLLKLLAGQGRKRASPPLREFPYDESDIVIGMNVSPSVNLIAIVRK